MKMKCMWLVLWMAALSCGHVHHQLRAAPAPAVAPAPAAAPSGPIETGLNDPMPLKAAEQGFEGKKVQHVNQSTMTGDWRREFGPKGPQPLPQPAKAQPPPPAASKSAPAPPAPVPPAVPPPPKKAAKEEKDGVNDIIPKGNSVRAAMSVVALTAAAMLV